MERYVLPRKFREGGCDGCEVLDEDAVKVRKSEESSYGLDRARGFPLGIASYVAHRWSMKVNDERMGQVFWEINE